MAASDGLGWWCWCLGWRDQLVMSEVPKCPNKDNELALEYMNSTNREDPGGDQMRLNSGTKHGEKF